MKKPLTFFAFALLAVLPVSAWSQSYEWFEQWLDSETGNNSLHEVKSTDYGTFAIGEVDCGYTKCGLLLKYDNETGKLLWQRRFTTAFDYTFTRSLAVSDAGVFVSGVMLQSDPPSPLPEYRGSFVRKFSHDGAVLWTKRDEKKMLEVGLGGATVANATGVYVGGHNIAEHKAVVRRLSNDGNYIWTRVMSETSIGVRKMELVDGRLYVLAEDDEVKIIQASDGAWLGSFAVATEYYMQDMSYHGGFLYLLDAIRPDLSKYSLEGEEIWRYKFPLDGDLRDLYTLVASDDGIFLGAHLQRPQFPQEPVHDAMAIVQVGLDGTLLDITEFWGDKTALNDLARRDGVLYGIGSFPHPHLDGYTARFSDQDLARPSILALAGATPAMPPRLAVLRHELGAGPVRVAIRDAVPESLEYQMDFSEGLKPVAFEKVADLNGNGYEELVVVSRLPAAAEVRDSLDGSLVSTIKLGTHFEPIAATIEQRAGTPPRLAIAVRQKVKDTSLLRIYNLANGSLLASIPYHSGFDAVDVAAVPSTTGARRYALLARNRVAGEPHKIELRAGNGNFLENFWIGSDQEPLQLTVAGAGVDGLAVLRYAADASQVDVVRIDLGTNDQRSTRYSSDLAPVAMLELPDTNGNSYPQYTVYGSETDSDSVRAETRDLATGTIDHKVYTGNFYRPQDALRVGVVPGFSDDAIALLRFRHVQATQNPGGEFRVLLVDVDGTKLFELDFFPAPCQYPSCPRELSPQP